MVAIINPLEEFYGFEVPGYVKKAGKSYIDIVVDNFLGTEKLHITIQDVVRYYATQANNIVSGCRSLSGHTGDWRQIDNLAKECLEYFKYVNVETLRREGRKAGLEPKF